MSSRKTIKKTSGIRHYESVDIASLSEGTDDDISDMVVQDKSKIRITTMIDSDLLDELKRRAQIDGDGRYHPFACLSVRFQAHATRWVKELTTMIWYHHEFD